jgi:hypothetical protein
MVWTTALSLLFSLLGKIPGVIGDVFKKQADVANANIDLQREIVQAQMVQAGEMARAQLEYQTAALQATTPIFKQRMFWFLSAPIIYSLCFPSRAVEMWENLRLIPEFYWTLYSGVVLTIWGIPVAGNWISKAFTGFTSYSAEKRQDKIQMLSVSSEQYKKAFADALRGVQGTISKQQWDNIDKALNALGDAPAKVK